MNNVFCKNDRCHKLVPEGKNSGRPKEYCNERCRRKYNARLYYKRAVSGLPQPGLKSTTEFDYPIVTRRIPQTAKEAEKKVKEHGENCGKTGEWCQAKLHDAYNKKKLCLVRAVFTDDWLVLMYEEEGKTHEREMTTKNGMWIDDWKATVEKSGQPDPFETRGMQNEKDAEEFAVAGGTRIDTSKAIPEFPSS